MSLRLAGKFVDLAPVLFGARDEAVQLVFVGRDRLFLPVLLPVSGELLELDSNDEFLDVVDLLLICQL